MAAIEAGRAVLRHPVRQRLEGVGVASTREGPEVTLQAFDEVEVRAGFPSLDQIDDLVRRHVEVDFLFEEGIADFDLLPVDRAANEVVGHDGLVWSGRRDVTVAVRRLHPDLEVQTFRTFAGPRPAHARLLQERLGGGVVL